MTEEATGSPEKVPGFFSNLVGILLRPSSTMRAILDRGRDRWVVPLILLALVSSSLDGIDLDGLADAIGSTSAVLLALVIVAVLVVVGIITIALFYLLAWVATLAGRFMLEGKGTFREVLSALAWGLSPVVAALIYKVPAVLLLGLGRGSVARVSGHQFAWASGGAGNWVTVIVFGLLGIIFFGWFVIVSSQTLGVAHRFTGWHGFACLLLTWISPAMILLAVVLTVITA